MKNERLAVQESPRLLLVVGSAQKRNQVLAVVGDGISAEERVHSLDQLKTRLEKGGVDALLVEEGLKEAPLDQVAGLLADLPQKIPWFGLTAKGDQGLGRILGAGAVDGFEYDRLARLPFALAREFTRQAMMTPATPFCGDDEQFHNLSQLTFGGLFVLKNDRFVFATHLLAQMTGYGHIHHLMGQPFAQILAPMDHGRISALLHSLKGRQNQPEFFECLACRQDGFVFQAEVRVQPIVWEGGPAIQGIMVDISQRKHNEREMGLTGERFRNLIEGSIQGVLIHENFRPLFANQALADIFGFKNLEELLLMDSVESLVAPHHLDRLREYGTSGQSGDTVPSHYEFQGVKRDGTLIWLDNRVTAIQWDGKSAVQMTLFDISDRKRAVEELASHQRLLEGVFDTLPLNLYVKDRNQNIILANRPFLEDSRLPAGALPLGANGVGAFGTEEQKARIRQMDQQVFLTGNLMEVDDLELTLPGGETRIFHAIRNPLRNVDGEIIGLVAVSEDVTQRKTAESEKKAMEEQVRQAQKMDSIGRLAGGIAHDFNNLLTVIQGRNQMVLSELPKGDPLRLDLEEVAEASLKAESLIGHLLTFSRQKIIKPQVLGLNEVIGQAGRMIQRLIGENLELSTFLTPDLEQIKMDQTQLEQVLVNLAVNSRDAMPGGGKLVIETSMADLDEDDWPFFPELSADCSYLLLTVSDNGHGIPPEILGNIFEPFFSTKEPGKGTGLGLSTVYGIVKQSGGIIRVDSELGRGTTFKIFLPVFVDRTHQVDSSVAVPEAPREINPHRYDSSTHETVLVVEDEEAVGNLVQRILETHGYTTLRAKNGKEAITLSHQTDRHIDLLLTDMVMPMMSGKELAFKMAGERPDMKIMFMSGYTDPSIVGLDGLKEDAVFMQKPFTSDLLLSRMREVLGPKGEEPAGVKKILVIDDDAAIRGLIKRYLDGRGFELFEASNGVEGLAMADSIPFDMVISDIVMPEKEGLETCMELRRKFPGIKIVAMSGANAGKDYLTMAGKLAADKILSKPFDQRILLDIIDSNLKKSPYPPS